MRSKRAKCRASMPIVSSIRIPISSANLYRVQTSNANDYPRCSRRHCAILSVTNACASAYHEICPENRAPLITPFCPCYCTTGTIIRILAPNCARISRGRERAEEAEKEEKEEENISYHRRGLGQVDVYTRCRFATKHRRFFVTFYSLRLSFKKTKKKSR